MVRRCELGYLFCQIRLELAFASICKEQGTVSVNVSVNVGGHLHRGHNPRVVNLYLSMDVKRGRGIKYPRFTVETRY